MVPNTIIMPGSNTSVSMMLIFIGIGMCFIIYLLINKDRTSTHIDTPRPVEVFSDLPQIQQVVAPEPTMKDTPDDSISKYLAPSPGSSEPLEYNSKGPEGASEY